MNKKMESYIKNIFGSKESVISNPTAYFYDLSEITRCVKNITDYKSDNVSLYFAMKANPNSAVVNHILSQPGVKGVEIASTGELHKAENSGLESYSQVLFTGPGKTIPELKEVISKGIRFINVESLVEAIRINTLAQQLGVETVDVLLRVNIDYYLDGGKEYMAGKSTKMGIDEKDFEWTYKEIEKLSHINVCGLHIFAADDVLDYKILLTYAEHTFDFVKKASEYMEKVDVIDFGGGFGIDTSYEVTEFDTKNYFRELSVLLHKYGFEDKEIILELGNYLVASSGYYATQIIDIKDCKGKKHIVTAGGLNHLRLPVATQIKRAVYTIPMDVPRLHERQFYVDKEVVDIGGPLCLSDDKISWDDYIEHAEIGDIVVLTMCGAYCYSAAILWFLSHEMPEEILVD